MYAITILVPLFLAIDAVSARCFGAIVGIYMVLSLQITGDGHHAGRNIASLAINAALSMGVNELTHGNIAQEIYGIALMGACRYFCGLERPAANIVAAFKILHATLDKDSRGLLLTLFSTVGTNIIPDHVFITLGRALSASVHIIFYLDKRLMSRFYAHITADHSPPASTQSPRQIEDKPKPKMAQTATQTSPAEGYPVDAGTEASSGVVDASTQVDSVEPPVQEFVAPKAVSRPTQAVKSSRNPFGTVCFGPEMLPDGLPDPDTQSQAPVNSRTYLRSMAAAKKAQIAAAEASLSSTKEEYPISKTKSLTDQSIEKLIDKAVERALSKALETSMERTIERVMERSMERVMGRTAQTLHETMEKAVGEFKGTMVELVAKLADKRTSQGPVTPSESPREPITPISTPEPTKELAKLEEASIEEACQQPAEESAKPSEDFAEHMGEDSQDAVVETPSPVVQEQASCSLALDFAANEAQEREVIADAPIECISAHVEATATADQVPTATSNDTVVVVESPTSQASVGDAGETELSIVESATVAPFTPEAAGDELDTVEPSFTDEVMTESVFGATEVPNDAETELPSNFIESNYTEPIFNNVDFPMPTEAELESMFIDSYGHTEPAGPIVSEPAGSALTGFYPDVPAFEHTDIGQTIPGLTDFQSTIDEGMYTDTTWHANPPEQALDSPIEFDMAGQFNWLGTDYEQFQPQPMSQSDTLGQQLASEVYEGRGDDSQLFGNLIQEQPSDATQAQPLSLSQMTYFPTDIAPEVSNEQPQALAQEQPMPELPTFFPQEQLMAQWNLPQVEQTPMNMVPEVSNEQPQALQQEQAWAPYQTEQASTSTAQDVPTGSTMPLLQEQSTPFPQMEQAQMSPASEVPRKQRQVGKVGACSLAEKVADEEYDEFASFLSDAMDGKPLPEEVVKAGEMAAKKQPDRIFGWKAQESKPFSFECDYKFSQEPSSPQRDVNEAVPSSTVPNRDDKQASFSVLEDDEEEVKFMPIPPEIEAAARAAGRSDMSSAAGMVNSEMEGARPSTPESIASIEDDDEDEDEDTAADSPVDKGKAPARLSFGQLLARNASIISAPQPWARRNEPESVGPRLQPQHRAFDGASSSSSSTPSASRHFSLFQTPAQNGGPSHEPEPEEEPMQLEDRPIEQLMRLDPASPLTSHSDSVHRASPAYNLESRAPAFHTIPKGLLISCKTQKEKDAELSKAIARPEPEPVPDTTERSKKEFGFGGEQLAADRAITKAEQDEELLWIDSEGYHHKEPSTHKWDEKDDERLQDLWENTNRNHRHRTIMRRWLQVIPKAVAWNKKRVRTAVWAEHKGRIAYEHYKMRQKKKSNPFVKKKGGPSKK